MLFPEVNLKTWIIMRLAEEGWWLATSVACHLITGVEPNQREKSLQTQSFTKKLLYLKKDTESSYHPI
jgi:hypothetical protein